MASSMKGRKTVDPLQKKVQPNPKYQHVQATVDSGASLTRYLRKIEEIKQNYRFGKDEIFKRLKVTTFVQLVINVHRINHPDEYDEPLTASDGRSETADIEVERIQNGSPTPSLALSATDFGGNGEPESSRSTLLSVTRGIGELDMNQSGTVRSEGHVDDSSPYLVLDIRDREEYDQCHLITALSYPKAILSRAMNYESREMLLYKNREGKFILIYDNDERFAITVATTLVQRGYDNVFMLSGGMKVALKLFPDGLFTGTPPFELTGVKTKSVKPANQVAFTNEDINKIEIYFDNSLQDKSVGSRLSKASTSRANDSRMSSRTVSTTSRASSMISDRPSFKP